jgi:hypothetical protein
MMSSGVINSSPSSRYMLQKDRDFANKIRKIDREVTSRRSGIARSFRMCVHLELLKKLSSLGSTVGVTGGYMFNAQYIVSGNVGLKLEGASHYLCLSTKRSCRRYETHIIGFSVLHAAS